MAQKIPSFVTGANAKIKVGGKTFAYAQDVSYQIIVDTIPIETMGRYEAVSIEPVNYSVAGDLAIVRYTKVARDNNIPSAASGGNGLGNVEVNSQKLSTHINPGELLISKTWDLAIFQKHSTGSQEIINITDCRFTRKTAGLNKRGILVDRLSFIGILSSDDSYTASSSGDIDLSA